MNVIWQYRTNLFKRNSVAQPSRAITKISSLSDRYTVAYNRMEYQDCSLPFMSMEGFKTFVTISSTTMCFDYSIVNCVII